MRTQQIRCLPILSAALLIGTHVTAADVAAAPGYFTHDGTINLVSSSHQDTAWMDTPAACRKFRIEHNIMPALEMMRKDAHYTFCMECTLHLMEFLEAHPELRDEIILRMKEGRLEFGATYNQPYESWFSGEDLVRETYLGRRWIRENLPGCDAKVAFNPDPPARSLQMQQILSKAGIPYMFISRYHEGLYRWNSPDGTGILAYTPGHYGNHLPLLNSTLPKCVAAIANKLQQQSPIYQEHAIPPAFCLINSMDFSKPVDFSPLINAWNEHGTPPKMRYSSIRGFFESIDKPSANFTTLTGERPDVWAYITGPTHHITSSIKREAAQLLPAAEIFTTFACMLDGNFDKWPEKELKDAWLDELYIDHGIGGKNGHISDEVFRRKVRFARDIGQQKLRASFNKIASHVRSDFNLGNPITVFNTLSWPRTAPKEYTVAGPPEGKGDPVHVVDEKGKEVPSQWSTNCEKEEENIAKFLGRTTASSSFSDEYGPRNAVDHKWNVCDSNPETGASTKWNSGPGPGPHWLMCDFGKPQPIHKVVIYHEGVIGMYGGETKFNTVDFQIQGADSADGPWTDLVPPITGNTASLTSHSFAPKKVRFLRVYITKGAQNDSFARIHELEVYVKRPVLSHLLFMASDVPGLGYKTYHVALGAPKTRYNTNPLENDFYRITLVPGGIKSIFDKQLNRELLDTSKFLGGEVFTMLSVAPDNRGAGTDAGEFGSIPLPVMDDSFDRVSTHKPEWKIIEDGPVRTIHQLEQALADTTVRQRLIVWHTIKRLDCEVDLNDFNGKLWREFRMALPLAADKPKIAYEVPMGVVEIGKDEIPTTGGHAYGNLTYSDQCRDIHPRVMQDFVDASDATGGVMMSSSVSVFDWIDPTTKTPGKPILQPVLLASRKSCNGAGVWYPQAGDHSYSFQITSHTGDWRTAWRDGISANNPLETAVVENPFVGTEEPNPDATLPPEMSFCKVSAPNVLVSTIKRSEDGKGIVARLWDIEGRDAQVELEFFRPVKDAQLTNLIEEPQRPLEAAGFKITVPVGHHAIETIKFRQ